MSEPDYPYPKKPGEPLESPNEIPPMPQPEPPLNPPPPPPLTNPSHVKYTCKKCGKSFSTNEELTMQLETVHKTAEKKV